MRSGTMRYIDYMANKIRQKMEEISRPDYISAAEFKTLQLMVARGVSYEDTPDKGVVCYQKDIEEEFGVRPPSASALIQRLEKNGLVVRKAEASDARYKRIFLTRKVRSMEKELLQDIVSMEEELTKGIPKEDMDTFYRVMLKMMQNI